MLRIERFFNCIVPIFSCNLQCHYCFVTQAGLSNHSELNTDLDPALIKRALTMERTKGRALINLCGLGETLLPAYMMEVISNLLENGHFVSVVTNAALGKRIDELCKLENRERLFIKCSFHYEELSDKNLMDIFFRNVSNLRNSGISYSIEMVANDPLIEKEDEIRELFYQRQEALPHILESRNVQESSLVRLTQRELTEHQAAWARYDSELFRWQQTMWGEKRTEFCMAGELSVDVDLRTGDMTQCNIGGKKIGNIYEDLGSPLRFCAVGNNCPSPHCVISYVWQGLCGNIQGIPYAGYDEMRNRKRPDGSEWLVKDVKNAFSMRCSEFCSYGAEKKQIVNGIMSLCYGNPLMKDVKKSLSGWLKQKLTADGKNAIVLYGYGGIGRYIKENEQVIGVHIDKIADRSINENSEIFITTDTFWNMLSEYKKQRMLVVVTPIADGNKIVQKIREQCPSLRTVDVYGEVVDML